MRSTSSTIAVIAALQSTACAGQIQRASSGQVGCPAAEITISNKSRGWGSTTWTASCRGNTYYCSAVSTGDDSAQISCKQAAKSNPAAAESASASAATSGDSTPADAPASPAGCQYDTQCKGERICRAGQCVDP